MKSFALPPFPPNCNPFRHDLFRMGASACDNDEIIVMWGMDKNEFIIVDTITGKRLLVTRNGVFPELKDELIANMMMKELN